MIPNQILRVLSTFAKHRVSFLLMGGQACILYGAAEFSRDIDVSVFVSSDNLERLAAALAELQAEVIAVPPFESRFLERGHAIHFRCGDSEADRLRVDVMGRMRGVDEFSALWTRRTSVMLEGGVEVPVLSLPDLVAAKKTQRDKDWPMIRRLIEANYDRNFRHPTPEQIRFWFHELRTADLLIELAGRIPEVAGELADRRTAVAMAITGDVTAVEAALDEEMSREREADRVYWAPLRSELEELRRLRMRE